MKLEKVKKRKMTGLCEQGRGGTFPTYIHSSPPEKLIPTVFLAYLIYPVSGDCKSCRALQVVNVRDFCVSFFFFFFGGWLHQIGGPLIIVCCRTHRQINHHLVQGTFFFRFLFIRWLYKLGGPLTIMSHIKHINQWVVSDVQVLVKF